jgi:hypothetical protein
MKTLIICFFFLFIFQGISIGQNNFVSPGTLEAGGELTFSSSSYTESEGSTTTFSSSVYIGVMAAKGFELGFRPGFTTTSYSGSSLSSVDLYFNPNYNFYTPNKIYPYLGLLIGYNSLSFVDESHSGIGVGAEGGMKFQLGETSLLLFKIEYISKSYGQIEDFNGETTDVTMKNTTFGLGFRILFPNRTAGK